MDGVNGAPLLRPSSAPQYQRRTFLLLCAIQAIVNYDSGAIPASLDSIAASYGTEKLTAAQLGILGSLPYLALTIMSPLAGFLLGRYSPKMLIGAGLILNILCNLLMAVSSKVWLLFLSRFCVGLTQSSFLIYAPVWVEEFGEPAWKTSWVALLQASVPIGIDMGYLVAGMMTCHGVVWTWSIVVQCILMAPLVIIFFLCPARCLEVQDPTKKSFLYSEEGQSLPGARQLSLRVSVAHLTRMDIATQKGGLFSGLFICTIFSLCSLFFVVAGMQYWCTIWLTMDFKPSLNTDTADFKKIVVVAFGSVAATAPILGVIIGGLIIDKCGGYGPDAKQQRKALRILLVFAVCASTCGIGASCVRAPDGFVAVVVLLWFVLFFGGAIVPGETGIMLTSIPAKSRPMASGIGQGAYNIFGYGLGTFLPGALISLVANGTDADAKDRLIGMQLIFYWSLFGVVGLALSYWFVRRAEQRHVGITEEDTIEMENHVAPSACTSSRISVSTS